MYTLPKLPLSHPAVPLAIFSIVFSCCGPAPADAATFRAEMGDYKGTIHVSGEIERGDSRKLLKALGDREAGKGAPITLELKSKGGDFAEALKIGKISLEKNLSTRLGPNAECLGPCAIIFMTGTYLSTVGPQLGRSMHPSAILGFSAPGPESRDSGFEALNAKEGYEQAVRDLQGLLKLASQHEYSWQNPLIKAALLRELMSRDRGGRYEIDTVRKAAEFEIELEHAGGPSEITKSTARRGCENALAVVKDSAIVSSFGEFGGEGSRKSGAAGETIFQFPWVRGYCKVTHDPSAGQTYLDVAEFHGSEIGVPAQRWMFWPGDKALLTVPEDRR
jgi:hypothetical protein